MQRTLVRALIALSLLLWLSEPLSAQPASAEQALQWQALADLYYAWDFNQPADGQRAYTTQPLRHNELALNLGLLELNYANPDLRAHLGLQTGT